MKDVYTIGHSNRSFDDFLGMLKAQDVEQLVDVRTAPGSKRNPQFLGSFLASALAGHGIRYAHMKELGGFRKPQPDSPNTGWRNESFRGYADYMATAEFERALDRLQEVAAGPTTTIMCAEAVPWRCHRSLIADALTIRGVRVDHIMSRNKAQIHTLTRFARVEDGKLTYPPEAPPS